MKPVDYKTRKLDKEIINRNMTFMVSDFLMILGYIAALFVTMNVLSYVAAWIWRLIS